MKIFQVSAFVLLGLIAAPAWAQTPDDNPVINAYRQQGGGGTPTDNFMYNAYQRHGPGTPTDNFMQDMMSPRHSSGVYQEPGTSTDNFMQGVRSPGYNSGLDQDDQNDQ